MKKLLTLVVAVAIASCDQPKPAVKDPAEKEMQCIDCQIGLVMRGVDTAEARVNCEKLYK